MLREFFASRVLGGAKKRYGYIGDVIVCSVKQAIPNSPTRKGSVVKGVIVRTKSPLVRTDGSRIQFDDNAVILLSGENNPLGSRVFGPVARELREKNYMKIISLAPEVL